MGSAMGCCGKTEEDANNLNTGTLGREHYGIDKIRRIVKIQAHIRGFLARKRVKVLRATSGGKSMMNHFNYNGPANYENPDVQVSTCVLFKKIFKN